jgi:FkbM family methyltransferase
MIEGFLQSMLNAGVDRLSECVIFDIGSRDCEQSIEFYKAFPRAKIFAFECNPNTIPICQKNIVPYSDRITLIPKAVQSYTGVCKFYPIDQKNTVTTWKDGNPGASSLFVNNGTYPIEKYVQYETTVECTTLEDTMKEHGISKVDYIWIDLQGAELIALRSMGNMISSVRFIHTEVSHKPMYNGQAMFTDINEFLLRNGFRLINGITFGGWQEDAIYMRRT